MKKLNCFRGQFDFTPGRFVYQDGGPPEGPAEQGEKREAPKKTPDEARREEKKTEVREKYGDDKEIFGTLIEATEQEKPKKVEFGRAVVEEYIKLLQRRADQPQEGGKKREEFKRHDLEQIKQLQTEILPKIDTGDFDVVVQPGGLIAVETSGIRIALLAPSSTWDKEFRDKVKERTKGNTYAEKVFAQEVQNEKDSAARKLQEIEAVEYDPKVVPSPEQMRTALSKNPDYKITELANNRGIINYKGDTIHFNIKQYGLDKTQMIIYFDVDHPNGTFSTGFSSVGKDFFSTFNQGIDKIYKK